eukprot:TRINITY_DN15983_c0_g1_i1.p1 TRINITY_DN15983_c0_g1~~TRINITY_DN15983_c0_g1_i1.p1  ORF type:complete len:329 (-),score=30.54 TRINITY_DN15983_c0_g1_i1:269-1222(-)
MSSWIKVAQEYSHLEKNSLRLCQFSEADRRSFFPSAYKPTSIKKNRYPDILPSEESRVRLEPSKFDGSDYINANYVLDRQYISCQAPILPTMVDFWRMIWEQQTSLIVMLTKIFEAGRTKAHIYWPIYENVPQKFDQITVTLLQETVTEYFVIRQFFLCKDSDERVQEVFHIHYTDWPDQGVPKNSIGIRSLCARVNVLSKRTPDSGPIVVHCSAGVGRSGSFIAIHHILNQINNKCSYDILETVLKMRKDRAGMVQTEDQYRFIHQAVNDEYKNPLTSSQSETDDSGDETIEDSPKTFRGSWRHMSSDRVPTLVST